MIQIIRRLLLNCIEDIIVDKKEETRHRIDDTKIDICICAYKHKTKIHFEFYVSTLIDNGNDIGRELLCNDSIYLLIIHKKEDIEKILNIYKLNFMSLGIKMDLDYLRIDNGIE